MAARTGRVNKKLKKKRFFGAIAVILLVTFGFDCIRRQVSVTEEYNLVVEGDFRPIDAPYLPEPSTQTAVTLGNESDNPTTSVGVENIGRHQLILSEAKIYEGILGIYDQAHPVKSENGAELVNLLSVKNEYYSLNSESILLDKDASEALNELMAAYNEATDLTDFVVYGTNDTFTGEGSCCPESFAESTLGTTVDLAVKAYDEVVDYDGRDKESWVIENCWKYGFIVRFPDGKSGKTGHAFCPWHLRYVGKVHSAVMHEKNMCLEEYTGFISAYTADEPFKYTYDSVEYTIFGVVSTGESTVAYVPISGNYGVSGNNKDGFIITTPKN